jgi:putative DNA primase/helicase
MATSLTQPQKLNAQNIAAIPQELRRLPQWVCWHRETRDGKPTKVPYDAKTGQLAATNQPATWSTVENANARMDFDGIGFVLTGTPYTGIDFDGVVTENGDIEPYVQEILRLLENPYAERTPSGRGLRAFVIAALPPGKRKFSEKRDGETYGGEIYSGSEGGRYLTVTGDKIQGDGITSPKKIEGTYFLLSQILDTKFKKLWMGDISDYGGDESRADLALLGMLARSLNSNRVNMESAFTASKLGQREKWIKRADYRKRSIDKVLKGSGASSAPSPDLTSSPLTLADSGNAQLVLETLGSHALFCKARREWYLADKTQRWSLDRTNRILQVVEDVFNRRWLELAANPDTKSPRFHHALHSLNYRAIRDCVSMLEFQQQLAVLPEQLDSEPLYMGVENGILDLVLGELVQPRLDLLVTKCAPVKFDATAKCDRFLEYLNRVQPDEENQKFLQRLFGSCLTGLQPEQAIIFFYGEGGNGKSVFVRVCSDVLGPDYCFKARKQLLFLSGRRSLEHGANDVVDLEGKRLVTSTEQTGSQWNWPFIKDFTGGELQHGRQLYRVAGNFKPTGKILVSANAKPALTEFDEAVRRRFILFPWNVTIPEKERIVPLELHVRSLLRDDGASGILNWGIGGLQDLIRRNWRLDPPAAALEATQTYIRSEDHVESFLKDWFEDSPDSFLLTTKELRKYFIAWLDEPDTYVMRPKAFTRECQRIFGARCHIGHANRYVIEGLRLSATGKAQHAEREKDLFSNAKSDEVPNDHGRDDRTTH